MSRHWRGEKTKTHLGTWNIHWKFRKPHLSIPGTRTPRREGERWKETSPVRATIMYVKFIYLLIPLLLGVHLWIIEYTTDTTMLLKIKLDCFLCAVLVCVGTLGLSIFLYTSPFSRLSRTDGDRETWSISSLLRGESNDGPLKPKVHFEARAMRSKRTQFIFFSHRRSRRRSRRCLHPHFSLSLRVDNSRQNMAKTRGSGQTSVGVLLDGPVNH